MPSLGIHEFQDVIEVRGNIYTLQRGLAHPYLAHVAAIPGSIGRVRLRWSPYRTATPDRIGQMRRMIFVSALHRWQPNREALSRRAKVI